jgi:hypothetical protein
MIPLGSLGREASEATTAGAPSLGDQHPLDSPTAEPTSSWPKRRREIGDGFTGRKTAGVRTKAERQMENG